MNQDYQEVRFDKYCENCKYSKTPETEDPCDECLNCPMNFESNKPVNWKEK